jgi:glyoxylase-like metal-dependent hydrolase (beta-lactamase superfamily II)
VNLGNWQLDTVDGGLLSLDGGVLFGIVPKMLWDKVAPPDSCNRVRVRNSCVLARDGQSTVLIDTGYGGKHVALDRNFYQMEEGSPVCRSLAELGVAPEDIDAVVFTHLHFDHVGGATHFDGAGKVALTFPRARHVAGQLEWADATGRAPELCRAYPRQDIEPLAAAAIDLIHGNSTIVPGLRAILTGGHTRGHLALAFESGGETALVIGDVCPTVLHLRRSWCLAYDTHVARTRQIKPRLLAEAAQKNWWVLLTHDLRVAGARLATHPQHEFEVIEARERL